MFLRSSAVVVSGAAVFAAATFGGGSSSRKAAAATPASTSPAVIAPWSDVRTKAIPSTPRGTLARLTYRADGSALATWEVQTKSAAKEGFPATRTALVGVASDGEVATSVTLDRWLADRPAPRGDGSVDLLLTRRATTLEMKGLAVRAVDPAGAVGAARELSTAAIGGARLATAPSGAAVVAWVELRPARDLGDWGEGWNVVVRVATRKAGKSGFGQPRTLQGGLGLGGTIAASIAGDGRFVVAYDEHGYAKGRWGVRAWTGTVDGKLRPSVRLGTSATTTTLRTAITPAGEAFVAWGTISHGEEPHSAWQVRAARIGADGTRRGTTQAVDPGGAETWTPEWLALATTPDGRATLAWTHIGKRRSDGGAEVRVATTSAAGRFQKPQRLVANQVGDLAVRADGTTVLTVGGSPDRESGQTFALVRAPGAPTFGAPELLGTPLGVVQFDGLNSLSGVPASTFHPVTGRPGIAWVERAGEGAQLTVQQRERP